MNTIDNHITKNDSDGLDVECFKCGWRGHEDDLIEKKHMHRKILIVSSLCPSCREEVLFREEL